MVYETGLNGRRNQAVKEILGEISSSEPEREYYFNEIDEYLGAVLNQRGFLSMERLAEAVRKAKAKMARYPW
jgi:hypothetical protein